jgi:hypothetical protein
LRNYDYFAVVDYDIFGSFYFDGVANSFAHFFRDPAIDALGANGIDAFGTYYDPFALVEQGRPIEHKTMKEKTVNDSYVAKKYALKRCDPLVRVRSCFAGLVIYKMNSILSRKYDFSKTGFACEHSYFNDGLSIFINPSMIFSVLLH